MAVTFRKSFLLTMSFLTVMLMPALVFCAEDDLVKTYDELKTLFGERKINFEENKESRMLIIATSRESFKGVQVIMWHNDIGVVHFIQSINIVVPKERQADVSKAFVLLNHSLRMPGLGMNSASKSTYFRTSVPLSPRGGIPKNEIINYIKLMLKEAVDVQSTVQAIVDNKIKPEEASKFYTSSVRNKLSKRSLIIGTYTQEMGGSTWELVIHKNGDAQLIRDGKKVVETKITLDNKQVRFQDTGGAIAVKNPGTYEWSYNKEGLIFKKVKDESAGRAKVLTTGVWKTKKK